MGTDKNIEQYFVKTKKQINLSTTVFKIAFWILVQFARRLDSFYIRCDRSKAVNRVSFFDDRERLGYPTSYSLE